jgi:UDP-N-acetylmuramyl pentapeptide synthase
VLVLGDMGEVGAQGPDFHREVGAYARDKGIAGLLALGEATREAVQAFGTGGRHFDTLEELVRHVSGKSILVKGSRFMRMERVVTALTGAPREGGH